MKWRAYWYWIFIVAACVVDSASAQAPINANVALQPRQGGLIWRQQIRLTRASTQSPMGQVDIEQVHTQSTLAYGLSASWTLIFDMPVVLSKVKDIDQAGIHDSDSGLADMRIMNKIRLYRNDFGINDTARFDLIVGAELPTGSDALSSDSFDPIIGGVYSIMAGRHAFDFDGLWKFNTAGTSHGGGADLLKYDLAYLYRLSPETYASVDPTAWFAGIELNGLYETNNDHELFIAPGLQYVTTRWIIEATVQLPLYQTLDHRPERDFIAGLGFRVQF